MPLQAPLNWEQFTATMVKAGLGPDDQAIVRLVYEAALVKEAPAAYQHAAEVLGLTEGRIRHRFYRSVERLHHAGAEDLASFLMTPLLRVRSWPSPGA